MCCFSSSLETCTPAYPNPFTPFLLSRCLSGTVVGHPQVLQVSSSYRELEKKYGVLTSMMVNQSQIIAHLEKQFWIKDITPPPQVRDAFAFVTSRSGLNMNSALAIMNTCVPVLFGQVTSPPSRPQLNDSSAPNQMTNNVQRDQGAPPLQKEQSQETNVLPTNMPSVPTEPPFISFPATKTPGTELQTRVAS